jgi:predicted RNase H-like nuclease (RuvC/YqgF family)
MNAPDLEYVKFLQKRLGNQVNEINDLSRKLDSARRVNRGLQRKKDLRLNAIDELREALYESDGKFLFLEEELERAYATIGAMVVMGVG